MTKRIVYILLLWAALLVSLNSRAAAVADTLSLSAAEELMRQGRQHFEQRHATKALACFQTVAEHSAGDGRMRVRALNNMGCVYNYLCQDYIKAYDCLKRAYSLCDSLHDDTFLPVIMVNMGDLMNDYSATASSKPLATQARELFDQCIQRGVETRNWELMTTAFFNLANQNYGLPLDNYRVIFNEEIPDTTPDLRYVRLLYRGMEYIQQGKYSEARALFEQQLPVVTARWEPARDSIATYMNIAYTYKMEGDHARQTAWLETALRLATERGGNDQALAVNHLLVEARADILDERQHLQQIVILVIAIALLVVLGLAFLLWRKNRELNMRNRSLFEKNRLLLEAERQEQQLRKDLEENKYSKSNLSSERKDTLIFKIQEVLNTPTVICQQDFTLGKLAKMVNSNTTYVSQAINEYYGTSFSNVLAGMRIKEACRCMTNESDRYRHVTIEAIAASVGFKSRTAFINGFKREVGLTPSEYLRMALSKE
jgi:AraC-like DNA-binding protein